MPQSASEHHHALNMDATSSDAFGYGLTMYYESMAPAGRWCCSTARYRPSRPILDRFCRRSRRPGRSSPSSSRLMVTPPTLIAR